MPFKESDIPNREKLKAPQEQQLKPKELAKQPKTQEEIAAEIKESAQRTERSLLSNQELLEQVKVSASPETKCKAKQDMVKVLLAHTEQIINQAPDNLIETYNTNRLSREAIKGLELTLIQASPESMVILGVSGELEPLICTEDNAGEFLKAVQLLDEVVGGNSAELQKELLRIKNGGVETSEQHDNEIEPLQSRFKKLFVGNSQKLAALENPEIQGLFNDFEVEINSQNQKIERDRGRADRLTEEIIDLKKRLKNKENVNLELDATQSELSKLKQSYSQAVLDKALQICSHPDLNFDLEEKTEVLGYILEKYNKYTAIDHCFGMCKDANRLGNQFFMRE
ncbi:MAG: hypothetical protein NT091_02980, partial [Candidatus Falkowbacteria bacterium]|nr:hypothetical protein [Candidatus Falkowbacteria bacterium]